MFKWALSTVIAIIWVYLMYWIYIVIFTTGVAYDSFAFPPIFQVKGKLMSIVKFGAIPDQNKGD